MRCQADPAEGLERILAALAFRSAGLAGAGLRLRQIRGHQQRQRHHPAAQRRPLAVALRNQGKCRSTLLDPHWRITFKLSDKKSDTIKKSYTQINSFRLNLNYLNITFLKFSVWKNLPCTKVQQNSDILP